MKLLKAERQGNQHAGLEGFKCYKIWQTIMVALKQAAKDREGWKHRGSNLLDTRRL